MPNTLKMELVEEDSQSGAVTESVKRGHDNSDAGKGFLRKTVIQEPVGVLTTHEESLDYNMSHAKRGKCLIFNHRHFNENTKCRERKGTEVDQLSLYESLRNLDFDVEVIPDAIQDDVFKQLDVAASKDYTNSDCFMCCVLTHGEHGMLWAKDKQYPVEQLFHRFTGDKCPSLAGKPKIFLIQACQGDKLDAGVKLVGCADVADSATTYRIPTWADFLIVQSTVPGYYSWRNTINGSWFIQSLSSTLRKYGKRFDLLTMLTIMNREVAYKFESCVPSDEDFDRKKQVCCITSMLTRRVFFPLKL